MEPHFTIIDGRAEFKKRMEKDSRVWEGIGKIMAEKADRGKDESINEHNLLCSQVINGEVYTIRDCRTEENKAQNKKHLDTMQHFFNSRNSKLNDVFKSVLNQQ